MSVPVVLLFMLGPLTASPPGCLPFPLAPAAAAAAPRMPYTTPTGARLPAAPLDEVPDGPAREGRAIGFARSRAVVRGCRKGTDMSIIVFSSRLLCILTESLPFPDAAAAPAAPFLPAPAPGCARPLRLLGPLASRMPESSSTNPARLSALPATPPARGALPPRPPAPPPLRAPGEEGTSRAAPCAKGGAIACGEDVCLSVDAREREKE